MYRHIQVISMTYILLPKLLQVYTELIGINYRCEMISITAAHPSFPSLRESKGERGNKGPSTLATLFSHMWPRIVADPSTLGRHVAATCMLCMQTFCLWRGRATACRTLEPQTAVCSPKLENNGFLRE